MAYITNKLKTEIGTSINITDALEMPIYQLKLSKESTQYTTTGKNKYNVNSLSKNNCTYIVENNLVTMTITGTYAYIEQKIDNLDTTKQYTISVSSDSNNMAWATILNDNKTKFAETYSSKKHTFTPQTTTIYIRIYGSTSGTSGSKVFNEIQLEEGNARTDYEEYTGGLPAPSPAFPQSVETVKGYRNLFDKDNCVIVDKKRYDDSGNVVSDNNSSYTTTYTLVKPNTTYTLQNVNGAEGKSVRVYYNDINQQFISRSTQKNRNTFSFTTPANCYYIQYQFRDVANFDINEVQLVEGNEALPYVAYGNNYIAVNVSDGNTTNSYSIPLNNNEIVGIEDYKDELLVDKGGNVYLNKKTKKIILDGTEDWIKTTNTINNTYRYYFNTVNDETDMGLCNYFTLGVYADRSTDGVEHIYINTTGIQLRTTISTTNNLKSWLQDNYQNNNPVLVYVPLATSQLIDLNTTIDITLFNGANTITNSELCTMNLDYYSNENPYEDVIYSQDAKHRLKVWFNNVEYENIDNICERLTIKSRIIPFGSKVFMLENFVSKEAQLILHDINIEDIQDQVKINIETYVNNNWVSVPMGIFNIQERPTTDKGKTTITLRDNSVKFDFNYNAQPLIENLGGSATKLEILQDICTQAGVTCNIQSFIGSTDEIGIYDNSIKARQYISYLAGQAGAIPVINRLGELIFIYVNNLTTVDIPLWYVESFKNGDNFKISRVVYESGIIKYESGTTNYDTLYLDSNNPYVSSLEQVEDILDIVNGFEINSFSTGKILGNPAIDSYDLISIYDENTDTTYITFACNELVYNGVLIQKFDSEISLELKKENVTLNDPINNVRKWAKTEIDNVEAQVQITAGQVRQLDTSTNNSLQEIRNTFDNYTPINRTVEIENSVTQVIDDSYTRTQIDTMLVDGTVKKVQTISGTFDENGMTYEKTNAETKTTINEVGVNVKDRSDKSILFAGYVDNNNTEYADYKGQTIVATDNIRVNHYMVVGTHSRFENYENGTGCFYLQ